LQRVHLNNSIALLHLQLSKIKITNNFFLFFLDSHLKRNKLRVR
jgi:hypothetical protein